MQHTTTGNNNTTCIFHIPGADAEHHVIGELKLWVRFVNLLVLALLGPLGLLRSALLPVQGGGGLCRFGVGHGGPQLLEKYAQGSCKKHRVELQHAEI
jgi:hypothetical protein